MDVTLSRRERLREATVIEIKEIARRYLVEGGAASISLRAIAREMGMSAPALYRYFPSIDALVAALTGDLYDEVRTLMEQARDTVPADDVIGRLGAASRAFRRWAIDHRAEFSLVFGSPLPGLGEAPLSGDAAAAHRACGEAGLRFGGVFLELFAELWARRPFRAPTREETDPKLWHQLELLAEQLGGSLPAGAVHVYLACWTRLYGMVVMEAFGHQNWALTDAEPLFEAELADLLRRLEPAS